MKKVVVIGGGVVGRCTAFYLSQKGHEVTILDKSIKQEGASYINAGYICPSHLIPLAAPGVVMQGVKWMFNSKSPLYIKPSINPDFIRWAISFMRSANKAHVNNSIPVIRDLSLLSRKLYDEIYSNNVSAFHLEKKGLLMLCTEEHALEEEAHIAEIGRREGLEVRMISSTEVQEIEKGTTVSSIGAAYYQSDWHMTPSSFMNWIETRLVEAGVKVIQGTEVHSFQTSNRKITRVHTNTGQYTCDELVIAAGVWSTQLLKKLGISLKLVPGKGYSINITSQSGLTIPSILVERKIATTPMDGFTRLAGTMEIGSINHKINPTRVHAIAEGVKDYYPDINIDQSAIDNASCGLRPVSSDGLPYIGKSTKIDNLIIGTGHGMMGWSTATGTGKLIQQLIDGKATSMNLERLHPER